MSDTIIDTLTPAERRAVGLIGLMIRMHGGRDGEGMFAGPTRYAALEQRLRLAATRSRTVRQLWDLLGRMMRWTIGPVRWDDATLALIAPGDDDTDVLRALSDRSQSVVMIARHLARARPAGTAAAPPDWPDFSDPLDIFDIDGDAEQNIADGDLFRGDAI